LKQAEEKTMSKMAASIPVLVVNEGTAPSLTETKRPKKGRLMKKLLDPLASLRLTVWLFALSIALVFFGTLAQADEGMWTVLSKYFRSGIAWIPWQVFVKFAQVFLNVSPEVQVSGSFPFPGGWLLGGLLLANLLAAHIVRFKLSWKRSGILLIHSGLVVMMLSELVTGLFAVESRMTIEEGQSVNYAEDARASELAVIDRSGAKQDDVVAIPGSRLSKAANTGEAIRHEALPFDVKVIRYMLNSALPEEPIEGAKNLATAGDGRLRVAVERPEVSGTESAVDVPSAYVTFLTKGSNKSLGTYLVSVWWSATAERTQKVKVNGKTYDVCLRFKRTYKPYTLHLTKFIHLLYPGTDIPKDYTSRLRLIDPERGENREVEISMNHPLRHGGETFYQADFNLPSGRKGTILQVVRNPGWLMPYFSCGMVAGGMLLHFGLHLLSFLKRRATV
jgi:hypothetical protein